MIQKAALVALHPGLFAKKGVGVGGGGGNIAGLMCLWSFFVRNPANTSK